MSLFEKPWLDIVYLVTFDILTDGSAESTTDPDEEGEFPEINP